MTNLDQIKDSLGEQTEKLENQFLKTWSEFSPYYTNLEPWQRGIVLIGLVVLVAVVIYYLIHESKSQKATRQTKLEQAQEEKIIRRMELLKKLRE